MTPEKARMVFAGGGTRVIAFIGALERVLEEKIFEFEAFAGVSAGSLVAFLSSVGRSPKDMLAYVAKENLMDLVDPYGFPEGGLLGLYRLLKREDGPGQIPTQLLIHPIAKIIVRKLIARRINKSNSLLQGKALQEWVERIVKDQGVKYFRELEKELLVVTFDLVTGEKFIFSRNATPNAQIAFAITASMSVWPLFPIKKYYNQDRKQNMRLVDGGLWDRFPLHIFSYLNDDVPVIGFRLTSSETTRRDRLDVELSGVQLAELSPKIQDILTLVDSILSRQDGLHLTEYEKWWTISVDTERLATLAFDIHKEDRQDLLHKGHCAAEKFLIRIQEEKPPQKTAGEGIQITKEETRRGKVFSSTNKGYIFNILKKIFGR